MLYVSSSSIRCTKITEAIDTLLSHGIDHIELSGGSQYYDDLEKDLMERKKKDKVYFLLHNYFPPPPAAFVLNLASANLTITSQSLEHIRRAISLSTLLGADKYAFHAGFLIDPEPKELGESIGFYHIQHGDEAKKRFMDNYKKIHPQAVKIYIENNVISQNNYDTFGCNPFMLTSADDYFALKKELDFSLLLDLAHLKVSCTVLGKNFTQQAEMLLNETDYLHVSDNDGLHDTNNSLSADSDVYAILKNAGLKEKTITLEIYEDIRKILQTKELIEKLF